MTGQRFARPCLYCLARVQAWTCHTMKMSLTTKKCHLHQERVCSAKFCRVSLYRLTDLQASDVVGTLKSTLLGCLQQTAAETDIPGTGAASGRPMPEVRCSLWDGSHGLGMRCLSDNQQTQIDTHTGNTVSTQESQHHALLPGGSSTLSAPRPKPPLLR